MDGDSGGIRGRGLGEESVEHLDTDSELATADVEWPALLVKDEIEGEVK